MAGPRKQYAFRHAPELDGQRGHYPVVIAGAGPIGMAAARDLALRGIRSIVLDDDDKVSVGSRAICWARRTLEIFERLGVASRMMQKGVTWNTGRVFSGDDREPVFSFDLSPDRDQCFPAFINLQQYYVEEYLVDAARRDAADRVALAVARSTGVRQASDGVEVTVETPAGPYTVTADYLLAADGSRSTVRAPARSRVRRRGVPGPFPHRGRAHAGGPARGALVLVRSAVRARSIGVAAQAAGRHLAARLPARLEHRSRR